MSQSLRLPQVGSSPNTPSAGAKRPTSKSKPVPLPAIDQPRNGKRDPNLPVSHAFLRAQNLSKYLNMAMGDSTLKGTYVSSFQFEPVKHALGVYGQHFQQSLASAPKEIKTATGLLAVWLVRVNTLQLATQRDIAMHVVCSQASEPRCSMKRTSMSTQTAMTRVSCSSHVGAKS